MARNPKKPAGRTRPRRPAKRAPLVVRAEPRPALTAAGLRRFVVAFVEKVNRGVDEIGLRHDALADLVFTELFGDDVEAALAHETSPTPEYLAVRERAGRSLDLDAAELSEHVRIGALRRTLHTDAYDRMKWTKKRELLPLVRADQTLRLLRRGVAYANRPKVGKALVRAWVQLHTPRAEGSVGGPRGMTLGTGERFVENGRRIGDPEARARLAERVRLAPPERRREFVEGLRELVEHVGQLIEDIEEP